MSFQSKFSLLLICSSLVAGTVQAAKLSGYVAFEGRAFTQSAADLAQHHHNLSVSAEPELYWSWKNGKRSVTIKPFFRIDQGDQDRTHADLREAIYIHAGDGWEFRAGVGKVFWGVTEALHLVDIINQTDALENPDGEDKLGQPMLKLSLERDWGILDFYALPGFRERTFPGRKGRLRTQPYVDESRARVERTGLDASWAVRWSHSIGDFDIGLAHFYGTSRDPRFVPTLDGKGRPALRPIYDVIHQTSLDLQATKGDWLWKLEVAHRSGQGPDYLAATGGFEFTLYGLKGGDSDLGVLLELMWDERGDNASPFEHDVFAGVRWVANDIQDTMVLAGVITDWESGAKLLNVEASRRVAKDWKLSAQARFWIDVPPASPLAGLARDDYLEIELARYF